METSGGHASSTDTVRQLFYEEQIRTGRGAIEGRAEEGALREFVSAHGLREKRVLEIGCGRGAFQNVVGRWVGTDLALSAGALLSKPFVVASAEALPFRSECFDGAWSITVLEHVPFPERALEELARVLKPGGVVYLAPAWHCRPWAAEGLHVRPWAGLDWRQRLRKASIPVRNALWVRALFALPIRAARELRFRMAPGKPLRLRYGRLTPNYLVFWASDSDACSSLDPHETLLWFLSRGWTSPSHPDGRSRFLVRHGALVLRKPER